MPVIKAMAFHTAAPTNRGKTRSSQTSASRAAGPRSPSSPRKRRDKAQVHLHGIAQHEGVFLGVEQAKTLEIVRIDIEGFGELANVVAVGDVTLEGIEPEPQRLGVTVYGVDAEPFSHVLEIGHQRQVGEDLLQTPARHRL